MGANSELWRGVEEKCCPNCFEDEWLRESVTSASVEKGRCKWCGTRSALLVPVSDLTEAFDNMMQYYRVTEYGEPDERLSNALIYLIQDDWNVFSERITHRENQAKLLEAILNATWDDDDGEAPVEAWSNYIRVFDRWDHTTLADHWEEQTLWKSSEEEGEPDDAFPILFNEELGSLESELMPTASLFRARVGFCRTPEGAKPFADEDICAPASKQANAQRANLKGQSVLYCADSVATAIAEMRPGRGELISVGEFRPRSKLRIVDLTADLADLNPFVEESLVYRVEIREFLWRLGELMASPVRMRDDPREYGPTQKLAKRIRQAGFDGIRYPSAMHDGGSNVVLFDPLAAEPVSSNLVEVRGVAVTHGEPSREVKDSWSTLLRPRRAGISRWLSRAGMRVRRIRYEVSYFLRHGRREMDDWPF